MALEFKRGLAEDNIRLRLAGEDDFGGGLAAAYDGEGFSRRWLSGAPRNADESE